MRRELKIFFLFVGLFIVAYFVPWEAERVRKGALEAVLMLREYAREHILLCLIPAFFIAGGIGVFVSQQSVMRYFGAGAKKVLAYSVASVSGGILAVCSCTVLPLFASIYTRGAGLGPATTFLYSGPAINVLAIILTARVLGLELGVARAVGAVAFSVVIGLLMHLIFLRDERKKREAAEGFALVEEDAARPLWKTAVYFIAMVGILVFANWGRPADVTVHRKDGTSVTGVCVGRTATETRLRTEQREEPISIPAEEIERVEFTPSFYASIYSVRFYIAGGFLVLLIVSLFLWFKKDELVEWGGSTWWFVKRIFPLLLGGVFVAGFLLGRPGNEALIPSGWIESLLGGNSLSANFFASIAGAFMYFATLTEVPILQGLIGAGTGKGPALALLLAGPALSLPSMLVIRSVLGTKKTVVFIALVVVLSTLAGWVYGALF